MYRTYYGILIKWLMYKKVFLTVKCRQLHIQHMISKHKAWHTFCEKY